MYFELDVRGQLNEYRERREMASDICALAVGPIPEGRLRSKFLVSAIRVFDIILIGVDCGMHG